MVYGYPSPWCLPHGILGNVAKHYGIWVPPPRCGETENITFPILWMRAVGKSQKQMVRDTIEFFLSNTNLAFFVQNLHQGVSKSAKIKLPLVGIKLATSTSSLNSNALPTQLICHSLPVLNYQTMAYKPSSIESRSDPSPMKGSPLPCICHKGPAFMHKVLHAI